MEPSNCGEYFSKRFQERTFYGIFPCANLVVSGPIIIIIHGYTGNAQNSLNHFAPHLQLYGFAGFALQGYKRSWNGIDCCGEAMENNLDDVQIILDFIDYLKESYNDVLSDIAYLIGHSNGAFLSSQIILTHPNRIQGAVLSSGHVYEFPKTEPGKTEILWLHSIDDEAVQYDGCCESILCCCNISHDTCVSVPMIVDKWYKKKNCINKLITEEKDDYTCQEGIGCKFGSIKLCSFDNAFPNAHSGMMKNKVTLNMTVNFIHNSYFALTAVTKSSTKTIVYSFFIILLGSIIFAYWRQNRQSNTNAQARPNIQNYQLTSQDDSPQSSN